MLPTKGWGQECFPPSSHSRSTGEHCQNLSGWGSAIHPGLACKRPWIWSSALHKTEYGGTCLWLQRGRYRRIMKFRVILKYIAVLEASKQKRTLGSNINSTDNWKLDTEWSRAQILSMPVKSLKSHFLIHLQLDGFQLHSKQVPEWGLKSRTCIGQHFCKIKGLGAGLSLAGICRKEKERKKWIQQK